MRIIDDFERGAAEHWDLAPSWTVAQDEGRRVLVGDGPGQAQLQVANDWTDYVLRVRLKLVQGEVSIDYRANEEGRYRIRFQENGLTLTREAPWGNLTCLAQCDEWQEMGKWHDVDVMGKGPSIRLYIDGHLVLDATDRDPLLSGGTAFETSDASLVQLEKVDVELLSTAQPDLMLALHNVPNSHIKWVSPYPTVKDQLTTVSVKVRNVGLALVDKPFNTELYVDGKLAKTWTFSPISEEEDVFHAKQPLMPGGSLTYDYTDTFSEGKHTFLWKVDAKNEIGESDESTQSNELEASADWIAPEELPDLIVDDISHDGELIVGQDVAWKISIKNIGKTPVNVPFITCLKADGVQFAAFWLDYLGPGDTKTFTSKQPVTTANTETIVGIVDVGNVVLEVSKTNNTKTISFTTAYVDLAVVDLTVTPQPPSVCKELVLSFAVKNNGQGDVTKTFDILVYPGQVKQGLTQPVKLAFPTNKLPLKAGESVSMTHKVPKPNPGPDQVWIQVDPTSVYKEKNTVNNTRTTTINILGMINGRLLDPSASIKADTMRCYIKNDSSLTSFRAKVALIALDEAKKALSGQAAKDRYGYSGKWCSEFVAWVYLKAGMKDIRYCSAHVLWCWNYVYLHEVTLNKELVTLFERNGMRFKWRTKNAVTPQTAAVGDYVSLMSKGKKKNHAGIIIAITDDNKHIWTVEGNVGDKVIMQRRDYFADGKNLSTKIDGIGQLNAGWF